MTDLQIGRRMSLEFIGMMQPREQSEIHPATGGGFDRVLVRRDGPADKDIARRSGGRRRAKPVSRAAGQSDRRF